MRTLLFVCQANVLRSAAAEHLARHQAEQGRTHWQFASAGVRAMTGSDLHPDVAAALAARGIDAPDHHARQLTAPLIDGADLVLTFDSRQRSIAIAESPRRSRSILTIRRAAAVLTEPPGPARPAAPDPATPDPAAPGPAAPDPAGPTPTRPAAPGPAALDRLRADARPYTAADDFADPIGRGPHTIAAAVAEIDELLRVILPALTGDASA